MSKLANKKLHWALSLLMLVSFCLTLQLPFNVVKATGTTYYVSSSGGNDGWSGTSSSQPWQSLSKVSSVTFQPGDTILFKRGDTWYGQLTLTSNGATSANWVYVNAYGSGDRPKIDGQGNRAAVMIPNQTDYQRNAGWNIQNLEVYNAKMGIYYMDIRGFQHPDNYWDCSCPGGKCSQYIGKMANPESQILDGLWIENCYIHHISGNGWNGSSFTSWPSSPDEFSSGIRAISSQSWLYNITIKNNQIGTGENGGGADIGMTFKKVRYFNFENNMIVRSNIHGITWWGSKDGAVVNNRILYSGVIGKSSGTAALEFDNTCQNILVNKNELAYTRTNPGDPDGIGIDFEGFSYQITVINNYFHDNYGAGILMMPYMSTNNKIINNIFYNNGCNPSKNEPAYAMMNPSGDLYPNWEVKDNIIVKDDSRGQSLFYRSSHIGPGFTDALPGYGGNGENPSDWSTFTWQNNSVYNKTSYSLPYGGNADQIINSLNATPPSIGASAGAETYRWNFNSGTEGWNANRYNNYYASNGILYGTHNASRSDTYKGEDINISSDRGFSWIRWEAQSRSEFINVTSYQQIKIRLKNNSAATTASVAWLVESEDPKWTWYANPQPYNSGTRWQWLDSKWRLFSIEPYSDWTEYTIDLSIIRGYANNLTALSFNLTDGANANGSEGFEIDWISLCNEPGGGSTTPTTTPVVTPTPTPTPTATPGSGDPGDPTAPPTPTPTPTTPPSSGSGFVYVWDFENGAQGWSGWHNINVSASGGKLNGSMVGGDPYMGSGDNLGIAIPSNDKKITISLKNSGDASYAKFYYTTTSDGNWDENKTMLFPISSYDSDYVVYEVDMSNASDFSGTLKQLRMGFYANSGDFSIDYIGIGSPGSGEPDPTATPTATPTTAPTPTPTPTATPSTGGIAHAWNFNTDNNTEGWWAVNDITNFGVSGGALNGTSTGGDPYIVSGDNLGVNISDNKIITFRYKNSASSTFVQIFYTTTADTSWNEQKSVFCTVSANDTDYHVYQVDMSNVSGWTGTLKSLRIDPGGTAGNFSFDYITIGGGSSGDPDPTPTPTPTPTTPPQTSTIGWNFNDGTQGWSGWNNISVSANNGYLDGTINGSDPYMGSANNLGYEIPANATISIRIKNSGDAYYLKFYYTTNASPDMDENKTVGCSISSYDSDYVTYNLDMSDVSGFSGTLKQLRLGFFTNSGTFSIDYITIG